MVRASCGSARSSSSVSTRANSWGGWSQPASATWLSTSPTTDSSAEGASVTSPLSGKGLWLSSSGENERGDSPPWPYAPPDWPCPAVPAP